MRILHTSDWHLGRTFHRVELLDAQARFLDHLVETIRAEQVDVLVVAGDVYDRALPPVDAVRVLDEALDRLVDTGAQVLMSSGNHDSAQRLGFGSRRNAKAGLHLRASVGRVSEPVLLEDAFGPVALYALPYLEPAMVADELSTGRTHHEVLAAAAGRVRADLATRPKGTRSVLAAHAFVTGATPSQSERDLRVGGLDSAPRSTFGGFDYVALGHLHGPQRLTETMRYSGSPLPYSFSEAGQIKISWLVELGAGGVSSVRAVPAPVHRPLARFGGQLAELLSDPGLAHAESAFCQVTLTDAQRPREPMERLRLRFPHTLSLSFEPEGAQRLQRRYTERAAGLSDQQLCCAFLADMRGHSESEQERSLIRRAIENGRLDEVSA